jgi:hypothetical protein
MQFLNSLPSGLDLQFVQDIKGGNSVIIENHGKLSLADQSLWRPSMTEQRCKRLAQLDSDGSLPHHSLILVAREPGLVAVYGNRSCSQSKLNSTR